MNAYAALAKHGAVVLFGFVLGLVAIAIIAPITVNGRILLLFTTMALTTIVCEVILFGVRVLKRRRAGNTAKPETPAPSGDKAPDQQS